MSRPRRTLRAAGLALAVLTETGSHLFARADLPIHCTQQDVTGEWTFRLSPGRPLEGRIPACGHNIPNTVESMLAINRSKVVPPGDETEFPVVLTEEILSQPNRHLKATSGSGGNEGAWTMVFDTGLEVRVGGRSLAAHFLFEHLPNATQPAKTGDNWKDIGLYHGRKTNSIKPKGDAYACYCDVTSVGWWHRQTADGTFEGGCMWGSKKGRAPPGGAALAGGPVHPAALVRLHRVPEGAARASGHLAGGAARALRTAAATGAFFVHNSSDVVAGWEARAGDTVKEVIALENATGARATSAEQPQASLSLRGVKVHKPSLVGSQPLPRVFDWREQLAGMVAPGEDPLGMQIDQGACGSCYAFAGIMMLQMRFRVKMWQQHGILYPLELSFKSATRCSPYTEGCSGGFSYFVSRAVQEVGVPLEECDRNVSKKDLDMSCDWSCHKNNPMLFFAKDYWHVGGFSHGSSEESIMREIYTNGPVELGFSTTAMPEFIVLSGQSNYPDETDVMTVAVNNKALKEQYSDNPDVHRWWYSTHAILCVGWGEDDVAWGMVKFWTVRNSWGRTWGQGGYAKMRRGNNDAGVETDASMVLPDMERLPAGFLEKAKEYHKSMTASRNAWAKSGVQAPKSQHKAGIPEYCKQRPDSPDCQ